MSGKLILWIGGIVTIIYLIVLIGFWIGMERRRKNSDCPDYDERQKLARGESARYALVVALEVLFLEKVAEENGFVLFDSRQGALILCMLVGLVYAVLCIRKDAYMSLYDSSKAVIAMCVMNIVLFGGMTAGIQWYMGESFTTDGRFNGLGVLLFATLESAVVLAAMLHRRRQLKEQAKWDSIWEPDEKEPKV